MPKVVTNPESRRISAPAGFDPVVDLVRHDELLKELDRRGASQRGKPRSRTPANNPLGCRVFDLNCGWPMYREPYKQSFRYVCGYYHQSHGAACRHNHVDGMAATRFLVGCVSQRVVSNDVRKKLEERLYEIARRERAAATAGRSTAIHETELAELKRKKERAAENLALAENAEQHRAIATIFDQLVQKEQALERQLQHQRERSSGADDVVAEVSAALAVFDRMTELVADPTNLEAIGELFRRLNVRLFVRFEEVQVQRRKLNRLASGVVTFGATPPPISLYEGPTGRRAAKGLPSPPAGSTVNLGSAELPSADREGSSLGNVSRGGGI